MKVAGQPGEGYRIWTVETDLGDGLVGSLGKQTALPKVGEESTRAGVLEQMGKEEHR